MIAHFREVVLQSLIKDCVQAKQTVSEESHDGSMLGVMPRQGSAVIMVSDSKH